jgi:hypothetical protein
MKALRIVGIVLAAIIVLVLVIAAFLPDALHVEKSTVVDRSVAQVQAYAGDFSHMTTWSAWSKMDPEAKVTLSTPASGVGASYEWDGKKMGTGKISTVKEEPGRIDQSISFGGQPPAQVWWTFAPEGKGTKVSWGFHGDAPYPLGRLFMAMYAGPLATDYEKGLEGLKAEIEKLPAAAPDTTAPAAH